MNGLDAGLDPIEHYLTVGAAERRDPHPLFSTSYYLDSYTDVALAGTNPLVHYVRHGAAEGMFATWLYGLAGRLGFGPSR